MVDPKSFSLLTQTKTEKFVILGLGLILSDQSQFSANAWLRLKQDQRSRAKALDQSEVVHLKTIE